MNLLEHRQNTGYFIMPYTSPNDSKGYLNTAHMSALCASQPCAVHGHPSAHSLKDAPLEWNVELCILERICEHGNHHPDFDSAQYLHAIGKENSNRHICDGCCNVQQ